ncbi:hypothetical protein N3K66_000951 [Trichothecium roseum]|uniref:Uncharacterized protein n=1 Tax=Trichothecium roseum TaxID=47278 RepID=A0ACC0VD93_9HYPO|nr:hypothetical protein N3K66_000951 [Trichothecium roseum]
MSFNIPDPSLPWDSQSMRRAEESQLPAPQTYNHYQDAQDSVRIVNIFPDTIPAPGNGSERSNFAVTLRTNKRFTVTLMCGVQDTVKIMTMRARDVDLLMATERHADENQENQEEHEEQRQHQHPEDQPHTGIYFHRIVSNGTVPSIVNAKNNYCSGCSESCKSCCRNKTNKSNSNSKRCFLLNLPVEIRWMIYTLALEERHLTYRPSLHHDPSPQSWPACLGDLTGYHTRFGRALTHVCRSVRADALAADYAATTLSAHTTDDLVKMLIAIGRVGRDNVRSLVITWVTKAERACGGGSDSYNGSGSWSGSVGGGGRGVSSRINSYYYPHEKLPAVNAGRSLELIELCPRLKRVEVWFPSKLMREVRPDMFMVDGGIKGIVRLPSRLEVSICQRRGGAEDAVLGRGQGEWLVKWMRATRDTYLADVAVGKIVEPAWM